MANWRKVIVSGSTAELNNVTASGDISASGFIFGNLPTGTNNEVLVYDTASGQLKFKVLNLIVTTPAPNLFAADQTVDNTTTGFKLSHDTGSSEISGIAPYARTTASLDGGSTYTVNPALNLNYLGQNDAWTTELNNNSQQSTTFYEGSINITGSISGSRNGLLRGESAKTPITISLNSIANNDNAVPAYNSAETNFNYLARSFNNGGIGKLDIYVNDASTPVRSINLATNPGTITDAVSDITASLFATRSNVDGSTGGTDTLRHARSGSYVIGTGAQRDGYNYTFAIHTGSKDGVDFAHITNLVEWIYDEAGAAVDLELSNQGVLAAPTYNNAEISYISGIKYFTASAATESFVQYGAVCENQYRNIYPDVNSIIVASVTNNTVDKISITQSGEFVDTSHTYYEQEDTSVSTTNNFHQAELQNVANAHTNKTVVTASVHVDWENITDDFHQPTDFIATSPFNGLNTNGNISFLMTFTHLSSHKDVNSTSSAAVTYNDFLVNNLAANAKEANFEDFKGEEYRIKSKSYSYNDDPTSDSWNSQLSVINGGTGHNNNNIQYYSHLIYPTKAGDAGNFTTTLGPTTNKNYSAASGEREYYRYFKVPSVSAGNKSMQLEFVGDGKIVSSSDSTYFTTDGDGVKVFFQRLGPNSPTLSNSAFSAGFQDIINPKVRENTALQEGQNHHIPIATTAANVSYANVVTVGAGANALSVPRGVVEFQDADANVGVQTNEFLVLKIVTPQGWTGNIDAIALRYGPLSGATKILGTSGYNSL